MDPSLRPRSWWRATGSGRCGRWRRRSSGPSGARTRCRGRATSRSVPSGSRRISVPRPRQRCGPTKRSSARARTDTRHHPHPTCWRRYARAGDLERDQEARCPEAPHQREGVRGDGEVHRGAAGVGGDGDGDGAQALPLRQADQGRRDQADRHRRPLHRDQGADRELLGLGGDVDGPRAGADPPLPEPAHRADRDRGDPLPRDGGLRLRRGGTGRGERGVGEDDGAGTMSRGSLWTARGMAALAVLFLTFDAVSHIAVIQPVVDAVRPLGVPIELMPPLGILELILLALYLVPRTAILGAVLWTGYLGGAVFTNLR